MSVKTEIESWPPSLLTPVDFESLERSRGWEVTDFINTFAIQTKETVAGYSGDPMRLREWQTELMRNLFAVGADG